MWKSFLNGLLEAFAMTDPVACMYYMAYKVEAERHAEDMGSAASQSAQNRHVSLRSIDGSLRVREGISA